MYAHHIHQFLHYLFGLQQINKICKLGYLSEHFNNFENNFLLSFLLEYFINFFEIMQNYILVDFSRIYIMDRDIKEHYVIASQKHRMFL